MAPDVKRIGSALLGLSALAVVGLIPLAPAQAEPDIEDVKAKVDRLYHEAEQAQERVNEARMDLGELNQDLTSLRADEKRQSARLADVREDVTASIVRQVEGESIATVGNVVVSDDPSAFLGQLTTMEAFNDIQSARYADYQVELAALDLRREATAARAEEIAERTAELEADQKTIDTKLAEAKEMLAELEAEERERLLAADGALPVPSNVPASGRAAVAVKYAMAQVGDAYVYGAAGESAFDCSGLTMRAWGTAGVALPHSSSAQFSSGPRISEGSLQPGDLVFYYSPISHVGMYIGNGLIVHAANPGAGVVVSALKSMPYVGAVRPG